MAPVPPDVPPVAAKGLPPLRVALLGDPDLPEAGPCAAASHVINATLFHRGSPNCNYTASVFGDCARMIHKIRCAEVAHDPTYIILEP